MKNVYWAQAWVDSVDSDVVIFGYVHELCHIIFFHGLRQGWREFELWGTSCDYAVNGFLRQAGFKLWDKCFDDPRFDGMCAEEIYDIRAKERKEGNGGKNGDGSAPGGWRQAQQTNPLGGDLMPPGSLSPAEVSAIEQEIRVHVAQAAAIGRMAGQMPAFLDRFINGVLNPVLPWYQLLQDYLQRIVQSEENWSRRNRMFQGMYLPALETTSMGEIVIIGDTSGSIGEEVFARVAAEVGYIAEIIQPERVRMIWADDEECSLEELFEPGDPIVLHPKGFGGTDMRKPLKHVEQFDPIVVVLVTDCESPWPKSVPYPLIILCTTAHEPPKGLGQVIHLPRTQ